MKIALLAPFEESVPPQKYGGTELVIYNLAENLVKKGHQVRLFSTGDSRTSAKLEAIFPKSIRTIKKFEDVKLREVYKYVGIGKVLKKLSEEKFDIIHNHIGWRILIFSKLLRQPMVTTLHGPMDIYYQQEIFKMYNKANLISISLSQRKPMPRLNYAANVYNGIEMKIFPFSDKPKDYFAFLARMSPEKGPVEAVKIAKKAGVKLIMAAKVDASDKNYFESRVKPLIDGKQIKFIGEVDHKKKVELLKNSRGLIAPIQWEEPFGLFFVEAMACGAPVIAMRRGSVPEIIIDRKTGFICHSVDEAARRVKEIDKIDRRICREHVEKNFSAEKMTEGYLNVYKKVIKSK